MIDLARARPILVARQATRFQKSRVGHQVDELGDWIRHHGREPRYDGGNRHVENVMAMRLHGYAVVLAGIDGIAPPPNPLAAAAPARPVRHIDFHVVAYPMGERDPTYRCRLGTVTVPFVDDLGTRGGAR